MSMFLRLGQRGVRFLCFCLEDLGRGGGHLRKVYVGDIAFIQPSVYPALLRALRRIHFILSVTLLS